MRKILVEGGFAARYSPSGHIVYANGGDLYAQPFDLRALERTGPPVKVAEGVLMSTNTGAAYFDVQNEIATAAGPANGIISYDPAKQAYSLRSYAQGNAGDFALTPTADGYAWEIPAGPTTIRYTTDGTAPSAVSGTLYTSPIPINRTTVLRAAAFAPGYQFSVVGCQSYLFLRDILTQTGAGFPGTWGPATADYAMDPLVYELNREAAKLRESLATVPGLVEADIEAPAEEPVIEIQVDLEAASTAVAWPSRMPATRWSRLPTPPEAITGTLTRSATARVRGMSKPWRVPSRSIEVSRISPAPRCSASFAQSTTSRPVGRRPPLA